MVCQRIEKQPVKHIPVLLGILTLPEFQKQPKIQVWNIILIDQALVSTPCYNQNRKLKVSPSVSTQQQLFTRTVQNNSLKTMKLSKQNHPKTFWLHPVSVSLRKGKANALRLKFAFYTRKIIWGRKGIKAAQIKDSKKTDQSVICSTRNR